MIKFELLPDDILVKIFNTNYLSAEDLLSVTKVCHRFNDTCSYQGLWRSKFHHREADLTTHYYTRLVLYQVHQYLCQQEFKEFFSLPPERQSLEKGAYFFAKWFQPREFLDIEFQEVCSKFDDLAYEVQSQLRKKKPDHPAVHIELFSPEEPLGNTKWSEEECVDLFDFINNILFTQHNFRGNDDYYVIHNSLLNKVIESKMGIPVTLSIIYNTICHRLGILLHPVNCPSHFLLKWKIPGSEGVEFIDSYGKGQRMAEGSTRLSNLTSVNSANCQCSTIEVLMRMANNTLYVGQRNLHGYDLDTDMLSAAGILLFLEPDNADILEFVYRLYLSFELHLETIIEGCKNVIDKSPTLKKRFEGLIKEAEILLAIQQNGPKPITCKRRSRSDVVKYATGMIMRHKLYNYICVIFGWDETCKMPMEWIVRMNVLSLKYQNNQPFYNVLVADGSHRYAAQENLVIMEKQEESVSVTHSEIGRYFKKFNGTFYVPNDELRSEYPDDENVRNKFFPFFIKSELGRKFR